MTVTFNQAAAFPDVRILEYRGVTTLDVTAGASGNSTAASSGAATTTSANELIFGANTGSDADQGGGDRIYVADHHVAGRGHRGRQGGDDGREQQCDGDVERPPGLGHADGDVLGGNWPGADGEQRAPNSGADGRRDGGNDHGDELRGGSDGDVRSERRRRTWWW